jgi:pyridoxine 5-phosphate synthase
MTRLGVNIDHIATLRQARGEGFPDPVAAARAIIKAGADGITAHLREDRRHIQDDDLFRLKKSLQAPLNMEMAATPGIVKVALRLKPRWVCLVPEKRKELTTEGGLDIKRDSGSLRSAVRRLKRANILVSLFVDPTLENMARAEELGSDGVELHTGVYARAWTSGFRTGQNRELKRIKESAEAARRLGLIVNAGHGLNYDNVRPLVKIFPFHEFNIGFAIVARAIAVGLGQAVKEMIEEMR